MQATLTPPAEARPMTPARRLASAFAATSPWTALPAPARRFAAAIARHRAQAAQRRALRSLDAFLLRDIGLDRSEIDSVVAENNGDAPLTRKRVSASC